MCTQDLNAGSLCKIIQAACFSTCNAALDTDLVKNRVTLRPTVGRAVNSVAEMHPAHSSMPAPYTAKRLFHGKALGIHLDVVILPDHHSSPPCYPHSQPLPCFQLPSPSQEPRASRGSPAAPHSATTHLTDLTAYLKQVPAEVIISASII